MSPRRRGRQIAYKRLWNLMRKYRGLLVRVCQLSREMVLLAQKKEQTNDTPR